MQTGGDLVHFRVIDDRQNDQNEQRDQPDKGEKESTQIEEKDAPEEIEDQTDPVEDQAGFRFRRGLSRVIEDEQGTDAHQDVEGRPDDRKEDRRRRERRCLHLLVDIHIPSRQKRRYDPDDQRQSDPRRVHPNAHAFSVVQFLCSVHKLTSHYPLQILYAIERKNMRQSQRIGFLQTHYNFSKKHLKTYCLYVIMTL